jgi:transposase
MAKSKVVIEGIEYASRTAAAKALIQAGKSLSEAAKMTGMTYQTVYANTKGLEKAAGRRVKYRILAMGKTGRTVGEIAKKTETNSSRVVAILKKAGINVVSAKAKAAEAKAVEGVDAPAPVKKTKAKKEKVAVAVTAKPKKAKKEKVAVAEAIVPEDMIQDNFQTDDAVAQEAMKDMASE